MAPSFNPTALAISPDNKLYVGDYTNHYVYKVTPGVVKDIPFGVDNIVIPSEDGNELHEFDRAGKHHKMLHALTGETLLEFGYNPAGIISQVTDGDGNITLIERDSANLPVAIIAPDGQRTEFTLDAVNLLSTFTNPAGKNGVRSCNQARMDCFQRWFT